MRIKVLTFVYEELVIQNFLHPVEERPLRVISFCKCLYLLKTRILNELKFFKADRKRFSFKLTDDYATKKVFCALRFGTWKVSNINIF